MFSRASTILPQLDKVVFSFSCQTIWMKLLPKVVFELMHDSPGKAKNTFLLSFFLNRGASPFPLILSGNTLGIGFEPG